MAESLLNAPASPVSPSGRMLANLPPLLTSPGETIGDFTPEYGVSGSPITMSLKSIKAHKSSKTADLPRLFGVGGKSNSESSSSDSGEQPRVAPKLGALGRSASIDLGTSVTSSPDSSRSNRLSGGSQGEYSVQSLLSVLSKDPKSVDDGWHSGRVEDDDVGPVPAPALGRIGRSRSSNI
jgi:hypothetical protein